MPAIEIAPSVESALRNCIDTAAVDAARGKIVSVMKRMKRGFTSHQRNATAEEVQAMKTLKEDMNIEDTDIVVIPADMGNATVVMALQKRLHQENVGDCGEQAL